MKKLFTLALTLAMIGGMALGQDAAAVADLKKENEDLKKRVEKLEQASGQAAPEGEKKAGEQPAGTVDKAVKKVEDAKGFVTSSVPIEIYGIIKFDGAYDCHRTYTGNYAAWVESEETNGSDGQFNATANQTRLGMNVDGPDFDGCESSGKVEVDFYGGGAENKPNPMMRHGYMKLRWPGSDFDILAGQTSDVVSPLFENTLNYSVGWWVGNYGYRRPQLRLTKGFKVGKGRFVLEHASTRNIGRASGFDPGDSGEDAGFPGQQARASIEMPLLAEKPTVLGVSGHWGQEEYDIDNTNRRRVYDSWSVCLDATVPLTKWLALSGEVFTGQDMDAYLGGIGQGVNIGKNEEIRSQGGWIALGIGPFDKWTFNVGTGMDDPDDDDLSAGNRSKNHSYWTNVIYQIHKAIAVGLEVSYLETQYIDRRAGDSVRVQAAFIFKF
ncbi:MAG TPA: hypothetical protein PL033_20495 [Candidatus Brocadiia bacterium]|nr:hypothetical protein [Candidatus Brocadiia bacterium]